ncbi:MAG: RecX family transcriptional regulator [Spirochaetes bacterium]|nr:RecX family transcriptional regulator [Spirochaetota bacterium]
MKITNIKGQLRRKNRFSIYLDGKYAFSLDYDTLSRSGLHIEDEVSDADIERLELKDEYARARDYLYTLLSYRGRSEYESKKRLLDKGFSRGVTEEVIRDFKKKGIIEDRRFAAEWLDSILLHRPLGRLRAEHELREKRVNEAVISGVCDERFGQDEEENLARRALEKRLTVLRNVPPDTARERVWRHLKNRGFRFDIIQELCKEYFCDHIE